VKPYFCNLEVETAYNTYLECPVTRIRVTTTVGRDSVDPETSRVAQVSIAGNGTFDLVRSLRNLADHLEK